jgi:membrane associated rhomboid family serine protease
MRESVGSLKAFFIVIGLLGVFGSYRVLTQPQTTIDVISLIFIVIGIGFSIAYLYIGISLRKLLVESPKIVTTVIFANIASEVLNFLLSLSQGFQVGSLVGLAIALLINWYLFSSVVRLSREEKSKRENQ